MQQKITPELQAVLDVVKATNKPESHNWIKPMIDTRNYRGKRRCVVGYSWSRPQSTYYGNVYDRILGYGETFDDALAMAKQKAAR